MRVVVNGGEMELEAGATVAALVASFRLEPKHVAVEVNRELVPRRTFEDARLNEGDHVEIVTLVGGGQPSGTRSRPRLAATDGLE